VTQQNTSVVGIIVARFQVHELHEGHKQLISHVQNCHKDVCIVLGKRSELRNDRYPLLFEERKIMVDQTYPGHMMTILPLFDHPFSRERWSKNLDALLQKTFPDRPIMLYGSRDSFIGNYSGIFPTTEIAPGYGGSGTQVRNQIEFPHTVDARAAIIYAQRTRPGVMYSTVDLAIIDWDQRKVLAIGKAAHDELLSFPGGFLDPALDLCDKDAVIRERAEEILGIEITDPVAVSDLVVDDPRYRGTTDGSKTRLFCADYVSGTAEHGDDAESTRWVEFNDLTDPSVMVPWHLPLGVMVCEYIKASESK
jgi:bifunctional NMN adenylyltransferase/nudix hydrolase